MTEKYYTIGKLVNTHALQGEMRVIASTDFPEQRFKIGNKLAVFDHDVKLAELEVDASRKHKNFIILHFKGLHNINDVEQYKGKILKIAESQKEKDELGENEYYYYQIIGLGVYTVEGEYLGKIREITALGPNDVWAIQRPNGGKEILIPYIADVVKEIDLENEKVIIEVMEGLID